MPKTKTLKPTTARVKPLKPRGKSTGWKCDSCKSTNPAGEVFCKCGEINAGVIGVERALVDLLAPTEAMAVVWPMLRVTGATDGIIREQIATVLRWYPEHKTISEPYTACWLSEATGGPKIWFYEGETPTEKLDFTQPDFEGEKLIATVRSIFGIPDIDGVPIEAPKASTPAKAENPKSPDQVRYLAVSTIRVSSANPRKEFSQHAHTQLVESIMADGLLQPLTVRPAGDGSFELLAGERRLRAAKSAGLKEVPALIRHDVDDAKAARIRLAENYVRENLNPIEEAEAFRALLDEHGFTQRELAEYFGLSQAKIANAVRIMKLPEVWRERVISREITATHARALATFADTPAVLAGVEEHLAEFRRRDKSESIPAEKFERWVNAAVHDASRQLRGSFYHNGWNRWVQVRLTKKDRERPELDVREVQWSDGPESRAFNTQLWDEFQLAGETKHQERESAKAKSGKSKTGNANSQNENPKLEAAARREKAQQKAEQHRRRLEAWYDEWLRTLILGRIVAASDELLLKIALCFAVQPELSIRRAEELLAALAKRKHGAGVCGAVWPAVANDAIDVRQVLAKVVKVWLAHPIDSWRSDLTPQTVRGIASELGIALETDWAQATTEFMEFLQLHDKAQLAALAKEWHIDLSDAKDKRSEMLDWIAKDQRAPFAPPKALAKLVKGLK